MKWFNSIFLFIFFTISVQAQIISVSIEDLEGSISELLVGRPEAEAMTRLTLAQLHVADRAVEPARHHLVRVLEIARTTRGLGRREIDRAHQLLRELEDG